MNRRRFIQTLSFPAISLFPLSLSGIFANADRKVVIGLDTTGPTPAEGHRLVEIAAVEIIGRQISGANFRSYLNPERDSVGADGTPLFSTIAHEFAEFVGSDVLILYGAPHQ